MCSLEEAYETFSDPTGPRNSNDEAEKKRKKHRRRALLPPEPQVIEPDRPAHRQLPAAELLGGSPTENSESTSISEMLNAAQSGDYFPHPSSDVNDSTVYNLEPDWAKVFNNDSAPDWIKDRMPQRSAESPLVPSPWLDGASTLWQKIPDATRTQVNLEVAETAAQGKIDELQRKLDTMFKKLEHLELGRQESNHLEIILFVLGGIFLLLLIDLLVKQGTQAAMYVSTATRGGGINTNMLRSMRKAFSHY